MRFVYLIRAKNHYKIGVATNLKKRLSAIQTSNGQKVQLVCARRAINAFKLESEIHQLLKKYSGNGGREWFYLTPSQALMVCIKMNKSPEAETTDLIIEDVRLDMKNIIDSYWRKVEKDVSKPPAEPDIINNPISEIVSKINQDALYNEAIEVFKNNKRASTSLLQRDLSIGYSRASRLMQELEEKGIVGKYNGSKARELLI